MRLSAGYAVVEPVWGWSIRPPLTSAGGASYPLPPPSTIIGALLASRGPWRDLTVSREGLLLPMAAARGVFVTASAGLIDGYVVPTYDTARILNIPYLRPDNRRFPAQWFGIAAFGVTYVSPGTRLCVGVVARLEPRLLEEMLWGITRLGSKEGLVSVVEVEAAEAEAGEGGETRLYARAGDVEGCETCPRMLYPDPLGSDYVLGRRRSRGAAQTRIVEAVLPLKAEGAALAAGEPIAVETCWYPRGSRLRDTCGCIPRAW